jgi:hypothetical protein
MRRPRRPPPTPPAEVADQEAQRALRACARIRYAVGFLASGLDGRRLLETIEAQRARVTSGRPSRRTARIRRRRPRGAVREPAEDVIGEVLQDLAQARSICAHSRLLKIFAHVGSALARARTAPARAASSARELASAGTGPEPVERFVHERGEPGPPPRRPRARVTRRGRDRVGVPQAPRGRERSPWSRRTAPGSRQWAPRSRATSRPEGPSSRRGSPAPAPPALAAPPMVASRRSRESTRTAASSGAEQRPPLA